MEDLDLEDRIIALCRTPKSREEIAGELGFSAISYMMSKYVSPLLAADKLKTTCRTDPKAKIRDISRCNIDRFVEIFTTDITKFRRSLLTIRSK